LNKYEALNLGFGMISRGEVGLIVASVGLVEGLIGQDIFSAVVGMILISTLATPPLLRAFSHKIKPDYQTKQYQV
jgi:Kef-type K+ transport system membrane component KefB